MDIKALRYFAELVRQQNFTRAAEALFVTQPTISKMVKQLEDELGTPLLIREGKSFQLTDAGRVVYLRGQDVLAAQLRLKNALADLASLARGELVVGLPPMAGGAFFAPVVGAFRDRYSGVELKMVEDGALAIESSIRSGNLEIGAAVLPVDDNTFNSLSLVRDRLCLVAPAGSPWQGWPRVTLPDLADHPIVFYPEDFSLTIRISDAFRMMGKSVNIAGRSAHWDFIVAMVAARLGIALLPQAIAGQLERDRFDVVPIDDERITWHLGLIWKKDSYLSHAARAWITLTRELLLDSHHDESPSSTASQPAGRHLLPGRTGPD